jgi:hypothetical protein
VFLKDYSDTRRATPLASSASVFGTDVVIPADSGFSWFVAISLKVSRRTGIDFLVYSRKAVEFA